MVHYYMIEAQHHPLVASGGSSTQFCWHWREAVGRACRQFFTANNNTLSIHSTDLIKQATDLEYRPTLLQITITNATGTQPTAVYT